METGFVPLSRKFFDSDLWSERRIFSRAEAWIDLIRTANFKPGNVIVDGRCISLERGELVASLRYVSNRWSWPKSKVERFYAVLKDCRRIETRTETGITIVKLCNYKQFNIQPGQDWDTNGDDRGTLSGHSRDKTEQGNKGKDTDTPCEVEAHPSFPKTAKDAITAGNFLCIPAQFSEDTYHKARSRGGRDAKDVLIRDFGGYLRTEWKYERQRIEREKQNAARQPNNRPSNDRNANTANAGKSSAYAGVGKVSASV